MIEIRPGFNWTSDYQEEDENLLPNTDTVDTDVSTCHHDDTWCLVLDADNVPYWKYNVNSTEGSRQLDCSHMVTTYTSPPRSEKKTFKILK